MEVRRYLTEPGKDVVGEWLATLKDARARAKVVARIARLEAGNFGDCKPVGEGVWELRVDWGPVTGSTTRSSAKRLSCCCAAVTSGNRRTTFGGRRDF